MSKFLVHRKKQLVIILVVILFIQIPALSQMNPSAHPGDKGVFILCGNQLPKDFDYRISRKEASQTNWQQIALLRFPDNEVAWRGRVMQQALRVSGARLPDSAVITGLWQKLKISTVTDSLYSWSVQPFILAACGTGWWDRTVTNGKRYEYQVELVQRNKVINSKTTGNISYPASAPDFQVALDSIQANGNSITVSFLLGQHKSIGGFKIYRTYYRRGEPFSQIRSDVFFYRNERKEYMRFTDRSVVEGAQYSYLIKPYDLYGNEGKASDTINVFNKRLNTISPVVSNFHGISREKENMNRLSWQITHASEVVSVDVYKALSFDGYYTRIGSVSPSDTVFTDPNVSPVNTYYYSLVLRTAYGRTFPSARIPVVFGSNQSNDFAPYGLEATRTGNVVKLSWQRTSFDTRGYYLYRAGSFTGPMQPVGPVILSSDSVVHFIDSLDRLPSSPVWVYAVASENTSYAISPLSNRVSVQGKVKKMPIPVEVQAIRIADNVQVLWTDPSGQTGGVSGYRITRRDLNEDNLPIATSRKQIEINEPEVNSFMDSTIEEGHHYSYTIQSLGIGMEEVSSPSMPAGVYILPDIPPAPNHVMAMNSKAGVLLQWDLPMGSSWEQIKIYRAQPGQKPSLLKTLSKESTSFTDNTTQKGQDYYYWIATVNKKGTEGKINEPVGIKVE